MAYFGGSKEEKAITHAFLESMSPEAAMTGNDVTWSHVTGNDVITEVCSAHARKYIPAFFFYYSSSTKCTIAHDRK
jgi:hypothetical protein